ncbi:MAG: hypothetical protein ACE5JD_16215 [Candidatus Methylomirabilia bacterium]
MPPLSMITMMTVAMLTPALVVIFDASDSLLITMVPFFALEVPGDGIVTRLDGRSGVMVTLPSRERRSGREKYNRG